MAQTTGEAEGCELVYALGQAGSEQQTIPSLRSWQRTSHEQGFQKVNRIGIPGPTRIITHGANLMMIWPFGHSGSNQRNLIESTLKAEKRKWSNGIFYGDGELIMAPYFGVIPPGPANGRQLLIRFRTG